MKLNFPRNKARRHNHTLQRTALPAVNNKKARKYKTKSSAKLYINPNLTKEGKQKKLASTYTGVFVSYSFSQK